MHHHDFEVFAIFITVQSLVLFSVLSMYRGTHMNNESHSMKLEKHLHLLLKLIGRYCENTYVDHYF